MVFVRASQVLLLIAALVASPAFASHVRRAATSGHHHPTLRKHHVRQTQHHYRTAKVRHERRHRSSRARAVRASLGQRRIDPARATQIQDALIKSNYLTGPATGTWDADTVAAMKKYQADHGWQTKLMPDSRALIALGLGPEQDHVTASANSIDAVQEMDPQPNTLASVHTISQ